MRYDIKRHISDLIILRLVFVFLCNSKPLSITLTERRVSVMAFLPAAAIRRQGFLRFPYRRLLQKLVQVGLSSQHAIHVSTNLPSQRTKGGLGFPTGDSSHERRKGEQPHRVPHHLSHFPYTVAGLGVRKIQTGDLLFCIYANVKRTMIPSCPSVRLSAVRSPQLRLVDLNQP